jgi:EAL domain-containing protein (putative c-di-GMP-specific phosphodiesterase class I)
LAQVAALGDGRRLVVIEVHEDVVADTSTLRWLRQQLNALGIGLAFDDFGSGQARLAELAEAPPDFIKLDRRLIRDIDRDKARQDLVQALNRVSADLGVQLIAEGIETREEAATCLELGCHFGQGFLFGPPHPVSPRGPKALPDTRLVDLGQLKQRLKQSRP